MGFPWRRDRLVHWQLRSEKGPRWNACGTTTAGPGICCGMLPDAYSKLKATELRLEQEPPEDLTYSVMKD